MGERKVLRPEEKAAYTSCAIVHTYEAEGNGQIQPLLMREMLLILNLIDIAEGHVLLRDVRDYAADVVLKWKEGMERQSVR
jgi:hypothetical protein